MHVMRVRVSVGQGLVAVHVRMRNFKAYNTYSAAITIKCFLDRFSNGLCKQKHL